MKLMVIDGNSIINRAYYGIRPLSTREGLYTHAVYGFLTTLLRLEGEEVPDAVCVTFDLHAPTFRHKADAAYKATRKPMPEELRMQIPVLKEVLDAMNIRRYELEGWEADDLLGTISRKCEAAGWECVVVTGDKDSLQLIDERTKVKLVSTRMGQTTTRDMTEAAFREEYGFAPIHMIDLKALMGDSSDNIPGVKGVGEKTAMGLVQMYGSIDHLYAHMPEIVTAPDTPAKPGVVKKLTEGEESARHSYWLATIDTGAPLDFRPEDNLRRAPGPGAYPLFLKLEFSKLMEKFSLGAEAAPVPAARSTAAVTVERVESPRRGAELLDLWSRADHVSLLARPDCSAAGVFCETGEGGALMAELFFEQYRGDWNGLLSALFSEKVRKVSHNVKDLTRSLLENGLPAEGFVFDTALGAYLLDATAGSYDLPRLFVSYFNEELPKPLYLEPDAFSLLGDGEAAIRRRWTPCTALSPPDSGSGTSGGCSSPPSFPSAGCWRRWSERAAGRTPGPCGTLARACPPGSPGRRRPSARWPGGRSTSTPPSSWGKSSSSAWASPTGRRPRPAGPPTPTCWTSSGGPTPSWGRCWSTGSTPS